MPEHEDDTALIFPENADRVHCEDQKNEQRQVSEKMEGRIPEAVALVEKAMQLAPDDEAILDSVGWGYYRTGKLDESVKMLRRAYAGNPDPEVAAHLGEVLWVRGDKDEARKIWQDSLKANPDNTHLQAVIKKFMP